MAIVNGTFGNDIINQFFVDAQGDSVSAANDLVVGLAGNDFLFGFGGNDSLFGDSDNDVLFGMEGDDRLVGGSGPDGLNGGEGIDLASYAGSPEGVIVNLVTAERPWSTFAATIPSTEAGAPIS